MSVERRVKILRNLWMKSKGTQIFMMVKIKKTV